MSSLHTCSRILHSSVQLLDSSLDSLDAATRDIPRLQKVLATQKVFGLVAERDLDSAKRQVHTDTHPQIEHIVERIEGEVTRLRRRRLALQSQLELQKVRLQTAKDRRARDSVDGLQGAKLARLKLLQNKKDRLKYSLSRLNLQSRRARLSLIPSLPPQ